MNGTLSEPHSRNEIDDGRTTYPSRLGLHPGVLGSIPKREEPGKTGVPCVKVQGSSRVPVSDEQTHPHRPRLVVSHSTCPPLSSPPPREQLCKRSCSNKTHTHTLPGPPTYYTMKPIRNSCIASHGRQRRCARGTGCRCRSAAWRAARGGSRDA